MRTNIDIDDELMKQAMKATGSSSKKAAVEACLRKLIEVQGREQALQRAMRKQTAAQQRAIQENRYDEWYAELVENGTLR